MLQPSSAVLTLGYSRAGPQQESPQADSRGNYCSSLVFAGMEVVQDKTELGPPHSGASYHIGSGKCGLPEHTLSTQPRHRKARCPRLVWGRHFGLSQPLLCTRHRAGVLYWASMGPQVPHALPLRSPQPCLSTDTPGQDHPPGHTRTRRDMQHCGMAPVAQGMVEQEHSGLSWQ